MNEKIRCQTCRFWKQEHTTPMDLSHCRRHAPTVTHHMAETTWPRVAAHEWCGDWESLALGGQCALKMLYYDIAHDAYFLFYPDGTRAIELVNVEPKLINKLLAAWEAAP